MCREVGGSSPALFAFWVFFQRKRETSGWWRNRDGTRGCLKIALQLTAPQLHNPKRETLPKVIPDTSTPIETLQSFPRAVTELPWSLSKASWQNPKSQPGNFLPWPVSSSGSPKAKGTAVGLCCIRELTGMLIRVQFGAKLSFPISPLLHGVEREHLGPPVFVWAHTGPHQLLLYQNNLHWAWI